MAKPKEKLPSPHEIALTEAQKLLQLWLKVKGFLAKSAATEQAITREDEQDFLQTKSDISRFQRVIGPKLPPDVTVGGDKMQDLLRQLISIQHIRQLPKNDRQAILQNWHSVFIFLSRSVGTLQFLVEGYVPRAKTKTGGSNISDLKKAAGAAEEKASALKSPKVWIALIVLAVAGYFLYTKFGG